VKDGLRNVANQVFTDVAVTTPPTTPTASQAMTDSRSIR